VHVEGIALCGHDAGGILAAMLQHLQTVVKQLINRGLRNDPLPGTHPERGACPLVRFR
jgi:hypothetical protein